MDNFQSRMEAKASEDNSDDYKFFILPKETAIIFFLSLILVFGGFLRWLNKNYKIPYTPMLFFLGLMFGIFPKLLFFFGVSITDISQIDPHGILIIFLPILIFDAGFHTEWHIFKKQMPNILVLAFPVVAINMILMTISGELLYGSV